MHHRRFHRRRPPLGARFYARENVLERLNEYQRDLEQELADVSLNAIDPAILNAISEESTVWYEPSTSETRTPCTGAPASSPWCIASWMPLSTAGRKPCGITPPTISSTNSYPSRSGSGSITISAS